MIKSFQGTFARLILQDRQVPKGFPGNIARVALNGKLDISGAEKIALPLATLAGGKSGILLDMTGMNRVLDFDPVRGLVELEAGIQWPELIHFLQPTRWAVAQKQTGADRLSIGGAISANAHGRGLRLAPLVGDVMS